MTEEAGPREADAIEGVPAPEQTRRLVGHRDIMATIAAHTQSGRLPGAILLHGPKGIGKATLAFAAARHIFAATGDESAARVEEQVVSGAHPNLFILRRSLNDKGAFSAFIRVDEVRKVRNRLFQTRARAGYRVCVIDAIDDCNQSAANALLKILEEPPAETVFLLISHRPGTLLPTIRSRCRAYAMRALGETDVREVVANVLPESAGEMARAIALAGGRPRRALEALRLDGLETLENLQNWLADPLAKPVSAHLDLAEALARAGGAEIRFARDILAEWLAGEARQASAGGAGGRNRLVSATDLWDKAHALFADADAYNLDMRQTLVSIFDALRQHARIGADLAPAG